MPGLERNSQFCFSKDQSLRFLLYSTTKTLDQTSKSLTFVIVFAVSGCTDVHGLLEAKGSIVRCHAVTMN